MFGNSNLKEKVACTISKYRLLNLNETVLIGLSGGPDSICLLHILHILSRDLKLSLHAVYVDHGLRPDDVPQEIMFCRNVCMDLKIDFDSREVNVKTHPSIKKHGLQATARELRYAALSEAAHAVKASKIALGHTKNDNGETLLINLIRGAGMKGLSGIAPARGKIIRPLLEITRQEILSFLESRGLDYINDPSNLTEKYLRNTLRRRIMPELTRLNPDIIDTLFRTGEILRQEDEYLEIQVTKSLMRLFSRKTPTRIELFLAPMETMTTILLRRVLRRALLEIKDLPTLSFHHIEAIVSLIQKGQNGDFLDLPHGLKAIRRYSLLVLTTEKPRQLKEYEFIPNQELYLEEASLVLKASTTVRPERTDGKRNAIFDANKLQIPLIVRRRKPGDYFLPSGFGKRKKIQDFFVDQKIPRDERDTVPLICSGENIIWIVGHRTDNRFLPDSNTTNFLLISSHSARD
ncbi:MAG: tRNA lysidine(34) synthetase TilS [Thermoplasmata archaeon M9B2D]|nr:MAG: tRNA lysidine(34) synthetase TilS [Thermoplasmata archaeon M9B2D]